LECGGRVRSELASVGRRHRFSSGRTITPSTTLKRCRRYALPPHSKLATSGRAGLNDEGQKGHIRPIEKGVTKFRDWLTGRKNYSQDQAAQKMIEQLDKYWEKLFADPITVQTPAGPVLLQPQRTNNILEQFLRSLKRAHRRRTGNARVLP